LDLERKALLSQEWIKRSIVKRDEILQKSDRETDTVLSGKK